MEDLRVKNWMVTYTENKGITNLHLIQIRKQLGAGQSAMAGQQAVGALAAHRQAGADDVPNGDLQHLVGGAVVNGQRNIDGGNFDMAHNAGTGGIQQGRIAGQSGFIRNEAVVEPGNGTVIFVGGFPHGIVAGVIDGGHRLRIAGDGSGLVQGVPVVGHRGVQHQGQANEEDQY